MKILVDTNVILDIALNRAPFYEDAAKLLRTARQKEIQLYLTATTVTDLYYIVCKAKDKDSARSFLRDLLAIFEIAAVDRLVVLEALDSDISDFEDAVQSAVARQEFIETIITRNESDFAKARQTILSPRTFLKTLE